MTTTKKVKGTAKPMPVGVAMGTGASLLITCVLSALLTWSALEGKIAEKTIGYFVMGVLLIASALGALLSAVKVKRRWMLVCCITGCVYYLILLGSTAVFFGGSYKGVGVTGLMVLMGCLISGMLGLKKYKLRDKRFKKYRAC